MSPCQPKHFPKPFYTYFSITFLFKENICKALKRLSDTIIIQRSLFITPIPKQFIIKILKNFPRP